MHLLQAGVEIEVIGTPDRSREHEPTHGYFEAFKLTPKPNNYHARG